VTKKNFSTEMVAKVFDPFNFNDDGEILDPFRCMNQLYTHEAGAYVSNFERVTRARNPSVSQRTTNDCKTPVSMLFISEHISPSLRCFRYWADWDWDSWLHYRFGRTRSTWVVLHQKCARLT
jgi:hypothetical protein